VPPRAYAMTPAMTFRILISAPARARLGDALAQAMQGRRYEIVTPTTDPATAPGDVDAAYCSRDITGLSTKHDVKPPLESFYTSLRRSP